MKHAGAEKLLIYCLVVCLIALLVCLPGCSIGGENPTLDPDWSDSTTAGSLPDPSVPAATVEGEIPVSEPDPSAPLPSEERFERDPYTTEFAVDRTLAQAVRENQGLAEDTPLTEAFAATVTELTGAEIKTLTGISHFSSLEWLFISRTDCKDITELTQIPSLFSVYIGWGYITEIPDFSGCPNLTELYLPMNGITDITPLCKASSLRFVDLSHNDISSVAPLKDVTFLECLILEGNGIVDYSAAVENNQPLRQALDAGGQSPLQYALDAEEQAKRIVEEQTDDFMTPEEKLAKLYAYVIDHIAYDYSFYDNAREPRPFGYYGLCKGTGVCGEYAEALCLLLRYAGMTCRVVTTDTHAFDAVELDGKWYLLDATWDDFTEGTPTDPGNWDYFGFTTEKALAEPDHVYDTNRYPVAEQPLQRT